MTRCITSLNQARAQHERKHLTQAMINHHSRRILYESEFIVFRTLQESVTCCLCVKHGDGLALY